MTFFDIKVFMMQQAFPYLKLTDDYKVRIKKNNSTCSTLTLLPTFNARH